jgi:hypothetical protein
LYTLTDIEDTALELVSKILVHYVVKVEHKCTTVRFKTKEDINAHVNLFTPLNSEGMQGQFTIAKIIELDLEKKRPELASRVANDVPLRRGMIAKTDCTLKFDINFTIPVYYTSQSKRTYILGFLAECNAVVELQPFTINSVKQYKDISETDPSAYIFEFSIQ